MRIVRAAHQGVLLKADGSAKTLQPGVHWVIPYFHEYAHVDCAYQEIDCELQTVETEDGVAVTFSANVGFEIVDSATAWTVVYHLDTTLERAARGAFARLVATYSYADLHETRDDIVDQAREALEDLTADWGIRIVRVRLTDFVRTKQYRLFGGHPTHSL